MALENRSDVTECFAKKTWLKYFRIKSLRPGTAWLGDTIKQDK